MKVYFISGLAADERAFKHIHLSSHHEVVHLQWIEPLQNESLESYALRLSERIDAKGKFALVGLSFGGMIATEISKLLHPVRTVLISSVPCSQHLPGYYKFAHSLGLHRVVPVSLIKKGAKLKRIFTSESSDDKMMLRDMINEADEKFIRWSINAILTWKNKQIPENFVHLHGSRDEVLPKRFTNPTHIIRGGGHLMVMTRAKEINQILQELIVD